MDVRLYRPRRLAVPLYEYRCQDCDERFETLQAIGADSSGVLCPACGAEHVERLLSTFAAATASDAACSRPGCGSSGFT